MISILYLPPLELSTEMNKFLAFIKSNIDQNSSQHSFETIHLIGITIELRAPLICMRILFFDAFQYRFFCGIIDGNKSPFAVWQKV